MVPKYYVQLGEIPLTNNGKVDRKSLPDPVGTGLQQAIYNAPKSEIEKILVQLWSDVLKIGKEEVGLSSDFFALAGDSIKAIQLVARMRNVGYALRMSDVLANSKLQDMAGKVELLTRQIDQADVIGEIILSPIQKAFFSNAIAKGTDDEKQLYHQSFMLSFSKGISLKETTEIVEKLIEHHDALRLQFEKNEKGVWKQHIARNKKGLYIIQEILVPSFTSEEDDRREEFFEQKGGELKSKIGYASGPLIGFRLFHESDSSQSHLLICIHHLAIDLVSWRILFEDIETLFNLIGSGKELKLPQKTDSYKYWMERNVEYVNSHLILEEIKYWEELEKEETENLHIRDLAGGKTHKCSKVCEIAFSKQETLFIQSVITSTKKIEINALLLAALSRAIRDAFEVKKVRILLEGHGREEYLEEMDISRTIGWFTSLYPFILNASEESGKSIYVLQEQLNKVPGRGVGYGLLRYLAMNETLEAKNSEVTFNFLGQFNVENQNASEDNRAGNLSNQSLFSISKFRHGRDIHSNLEMESNLLVTGQISNGSLQMNIQFSSERMEERKVRFLAERYRMHLIKIAEELSESDQKVQLPSSFSFKGLSFDALTELKRKYGEIEDVFPLNGSQLGLLFVNDTNNDSGLYTEQFVDEFFGSLNLERWINALFQMISLNQALRLVFRTDLTLEPIQICLKDFNLNYGFVDLSDCSNTEIQKRIEEIIRKDYSLPFDLINEPPFRVTFIKLAENRYIRIWTNHHIIMDGWSSQIFFEQWANFYKDSRIETKKSEQELSGYFHFLSRLDKNKSFLFWNNYLKEYEKTMSFIPVPFHAPEMIDMEFREFQLESLGTYRLVEFAKKHKFTLSGVVQALFGILLAKMNNSNDAVFASVVSGRPNVVKNIENLIFNFVNLIPVRIKFNEQESFLNIIHSLSDFFVQIEEHQYLPLNETCKVIPDGAGALKVLFVFENYPSSTNNQKNTDEKIEFNRLQVNDKLEFDVTVLCGQDGDSLKFIWKSEEGRYSAQQVDSIFLMFNHLINLLIDDCNALVEASSLLNYKESETLVGLSEGKIINESFSDFASLFEGTFIKYSSCTAIAGIEADYTYTEIDELSNKFANYLLGVKRLKKGDVVAVELQRSEWIPISFLGIAKAGLVFLFVDMNFPENRISFIKENSDVKYTFTSNELAEFRNNLGSISNVKRLSKCSESDLLYIIYTSGTTGNPKGCALTHLNMFNLYLYMIHETDLMEDNCRVLQFTTWSFDLSIQEFINALFSGGQLICLSEEDRNDYSLLTNRIVETQANIIYLSPSFLNALISFEFFVNANTNLKYVVSAGEQLFISNPLRDYLKKNGIIVYNLYGPAETHVVTGRKLDYLDFDRRPDIGLPTCNNQIWILDNSLNILPIGVQGEVFITGDSLGIGYVNNSIENARRFIIHEQYGRMYKTGDLAFRDFEGNIHYMGRIDDQVKINGVRIELDEIVKCMKSNEEVTNAIAITLNNNLNSKYICSFYTGEISQEDLRTFLSDRLPISFVPSKIIRIPNMPLNSNGKIDKNQLKSLVAEADEKDSISHRRPETWLQIELIKILCEIISISAEEVSIEAGFHSMGLTSLQYIQFVSLLNVKLGTSVSIKDVIQSNCISGLFELIMKPNNKSSETLYSLTGSLDLSKPFVILFPAFSGEGLYYLELAKYYKEYCNVFSCNYYSGTEEMFDTDDFARRISAEIKSYGFSNVILGGASYGFRVAYRVAYYSPKLVSRILNFDGSVYNSLEDEMASIVRINNHEMVGLSEIELKQRQESLAKYISGDRKLKYQNDYYLSQLENVEIVNFFPEESAVKFYSRGDLTNGKIIDVKISGNHENMLTISNNFRIIKDFISSHE
jgi:amino acid adenylation domain-containing protein/non-ribosomal peptide synthase protein (TIGR01720 family)